MQSRHTRQTRPTATEHSCPRTSHTLDRDTSLTEFPKVEILSSGTSNHSGMRLGTNDKRKTVTKYSQRPMGQRRNQKRIPRVSRGNESERSTYQPQRGAARAALRGNFVAINAYVCQQTNKTPQINNLSSSLKESEKEEETKLEVRRMQEMARISAEMNETH